MLPAPRTRAFVPLPVLCTTKVRACVSARLVLAPTITSAMTVRWRANSRGFLLRGLAQRGNANHARVAGAARGEGAPSPCRLQLRSTPCAFPPRRWHCSCMLPTPLNGSARASAFACYPGSLSALAKYAKYASALRLLEALVAAHCVPILKLGIICMRNMHACHWPRVSSDPPPLPRRGFPTDFASHEALMAGSTHQP